MALAANLLIATIGFWLACCVGFGMADKKISQILAAASLLLGGAGLMVTAIYGWSQDTTFVLAGLPSLPIYLAVAPFTCRINALSSIFMGLLGILTIAVAFYSPGYLIHLDKKMNKGAYWVQLILFILGMVGVLVAANAPTFLLTWEVMALSSALLIATNLANHESRRAAFIYLGATRIATAFLMAAFFWMFAITQSWDFRDWSMNTPATAGPALLLLIAFCIKGGIWPFHEWLPYAHPSAPAPVSALMSGIMIKVAIFAMIRFFVVGGLNNLCIIYLMLALGVITAFWGILSALMQKDMKCLLAYSSIENMGLLLIGVSMALIARSSDLPIVASISLAAAIFHAFNHGLFKSLLFLGAGTIDMRVHTRDLELMGGLGKKMPGTMLCFIIGSAAICSLPPLNGFSSKWLLYQSLFQMAYRSNSLWLGGLSVTCIAILGLVSGMSLYTFTKAIGISFLGRPRSGASANATEGSRYMMASQLLLALCCAFLGLLAPVALKIIEPACVASLQTEVNLPSLYTMPMAPFAFILGTIVVIVYGIFLTGKPTSIRSYITWDCGFGSMTKRMQGTATSFTENIGHTFAPLLEYDAHTVIAGRDRRHFPEMIEEKAHFTSISEVHVFRPAVKGVQWLGALMVQLQAGSIHMYLGFILVTLVALLVIGVLI